MYTVYVLQDISGKLYKGMTNNLDRRLSEHRRGETKSTSRLQGITVVYSEVYEDPITARRRELYLKSSAGRRFLKTKIPNTV